MCEKRGKRTLHDFLKGQYESLSNLTSENKTLVKETPEDDSMNHLNEGEWSIESQNDPTVGDIQLKVPDEDCTNYGNNVIDKRSMNLFF